MTKTERKKQPCLVQETKDEFSLEVQKMVDGVVDDKACVCIVVQSLIVLNYFLRVLIYWFLK